MTQEEKQLVLIDLSARLPYGTICRCRTTEDSTWWNTDHRIFGITGGKFDVGSDILDAEQIKPYLRPLSSMTEEEKKDFSSHIMNDKCDEDGVIIDVHNITSLQIYYYYFKDVIDWLLAHHFDYRELIEKGLALEAPEGMYKTE